MEINTVPPLPVPFESSSTFNGIHGGTEVNVQRELRQVPVPPVPESKTQTRGDDASTERKVIWVTEERRPVYRVMDSRTEGVICQIPSEEVLRVARHFEEELQVGSAASAEDLKVLEIDVRS